MEWRVFKTTLERYTYLECSLLRSIKKNESGRMIAQLFYYERFSQFVFKKLRL